MKIVKRKTMTTFKEAFEQMDKQDLTMEDKKLIEIETLEIAGMASVLQALRLPFGLECRSAINIDIQGCTKEIGKRWLSVMSDVSIDEKDIHLLSTLVKRGEEHCKALRGLVVYLEINAPRYFWQEMDTYRIGTERLSSASTMHIQGKGMSTEDLVKMKDELPEGTMQKRIQMFSYPTLRRIYIQRRNHRLPHWKVFCRYIEELPFAKELILVGLDNE